MRRHLAQVAGLNTHTHAHTHKAHAYVTHTYIHIYTQNTCIYHTQRAHVYTTHTHKLLNEFWTGIKTKFSIISEMTLNMFLVFHSMYYTLKITKSKYWPTLYIIYNSISKYVGYSMSSSNKWSDKILFFMSK